MAQTAVDPLAGSNMSDLVSPLNSGFGITPSDTEELDNVTRELYVGTGGDIAVVLADNSAFTLSNVPTGSRLPYRVRQVKATNTTATDLVGLY